MQKASRVKPLEGEWFPETRYIYLTNAVGGKFAFDALSNGVVFTCLPLSSIEADFDALCMDGFPVPGTTRAGTIDRALTKLGVERGRFPIIVALLIHGGSVHGNDGGPSIELPVWAVEATTPDLVRDLRLIAEPATSRRKLSVSEVVVLEPRFLLGVLGADVSGPRPDKTSVPLGQTFTWQDVSFHLTLGWKVPSSSEEPLGSASRSDTVSAPTSAELVINSYEITSSSVKVVRNDPFDAPPNYALTVYFSDLIRGEQVDGKAEFHYISVDGVDLTRRGVARGERFGQRDLRQLSHRIGIALIKLNEAYGELSKYRLMEELLQRSVYSRTSGDFEYLTVVPAGNWFTYEHAGKPQRMTLCSHIVMVFHFTPNGPHLGRDRTVQSILDTGLWWSSLYKDAQVVCRTCLVCQFQKNTPLITRHQRSREYDGPFRYLIIDFVGPMNPPSRRGHRYMFTCVCAWNGWYRAFPVMDDSSQTAVECLFYYIICDIAGFLLDIGSDRGLAFVEGAVKDLLQVFGVEQVLGSAYHPQAQSAVERPHREYNELCKAFMESTQGWDRMCYIFVWTIRSTPREALGHFSPYEIITGLKPRSPLE